MKLVFNLGLKGLPFLLGITSVYLINSSGNEETKATLLSLQYGMFLFTGWCSLNFRQKLLTNRWTSKPTQTKHYRSSLTFFIAPAAISCLIWKYNNTSNGLHAPLIALALLTASSYLNSYTYANSWANRNLHISYLSDCIPSAAIILSLLSLNHQPTTLITAWATATFIISLLASVATRSYEDIFATHPTLSLIFSSINSQLIAIISFFELFLFSGINSNDIATYRYITILTMGTVAIITVIKQQYIEKLKDKQTSQITPLIALTLSIAALVWHHTQSSTNILPTGVILITLCILQASLSINGIKFHQRNKSHINLIPTLATIIYILFLLAIGEKPSSPAALFNLKLQIISTNTALTAITFLFFPERSKQPNQ